MVKQNEKVAKQNKITNIEKFCRKKYCKKLHKLISQQHWPSQMQDPGVVRLLFLQYMTQYTEPGKKTHESRNEEILCKKKSKI